MSDNVIAFPNAAPMAKTEPFELALVAVKLLIDHSAESALHIIDLWVDKGLITKQQRQSLYNFYGLSQ